jgi:phospho-N-acetylmuramoyl-pentapeptide-transferase
LFSFGAIGFFDDYKKVIKKENLGLQARIKFPLQVILSLVAGFLLLQYLDFSTELVVPFFKNLHPDLGWVYLAVVSLVVVGTSNAVNLTDGLDGLVAGPNIMAFATYGVLVYVVGNAVLADYLQVVFVPGAGELAVFCGAMVGGLLGFLWFNSYPAEIFMGDTGSLSIGAALGMVAILAKAEILLILIGGVFVLETVSVITQVISFKLYGKRIFKMAPIHHHFELKGWAEPKVIIRFWIISFILSLLSLSTLKIR